MVSLGLLTSPLPDSRWQRHLMDSTIIRNVGLAMAHTLLSARSAMNGFERINPNRRVIRTALNENWAILGEPAQSIMKLDGVLDSYSMAEKFTKGNKISQEAWIDWVHELPISDEHKAKLAWLTPRDYIGYAKYLTDDALEQISLPHIDVFGNTYRIGGAKQQTKVPDKNKGMLRKAHSHSIYDDGS